MMIISVSSTSGFSRLVLPSNEVILTNIYSKLLDEVRLALQGISRDTEGMLYQSSICQQDTDIASADHISLLTVILR